MAIRGDLSVDWSASPRIVTVAAPSTELTMQDLLDTLRSLEAQPSAMDEPAIVDASGKENLGGGTKVGLTVKLLNAKVAFEARPGPAWVLCSLTGGNLVAVDADGNDMDVRQPTAYVTIDRVSSASATLQEQDALQYASYQNKVWIDPVGGDTGTAFPCGTREHPVSNLVDALDIAIHRGFNTLHIMGDMLLDSGTDMTNFVIEGESPLLTHVEIAPEAVTNNCRFTHMAISGTLDHNTWLEDCHIDDLAYVEGRIVRCAIDGVVTLGGTSGALFLDCYSARLEPDQIGVIDMGGAGRNCAVHNHSGHLMLRNMSGADNIAALSFSRGNLIIEDTVSAGMVHVMGTVKVEDHHTGSATVLLDYVNSPGMIAAKVADEMLAGHTLDGSLGKTLADIRTKTAGLPNGIKRGVDMTFSIGLPADGLSVAGVLSKDLGAFAALSNPIIGKGNRQYGVSLTDAEMDAADLYLLFTADGMDPVPLTLRTSA